MLCSLAQSFYERDFTLDGVRKGLLCSTCAKCFVDPERIHIDKQANGSRYHQECTPRTNGAIIETDEFPIHELAQSVYNDNVNELGKRAFKMTDEEFENETQYFQLAKGL